jgi:hypothetical protein
MCMLPRASLLDAVSHVMSRRPRNGLGICVSELLGLGGEGRRSAGVERSWNSVLLGVFGPDLVEVSVGC